MSFPTFLFSDPALGGTAFTVTRKLFRPVNGVNTFQSSSATSAAGCVHPASPEDLTLIPEEVRRRETIVLYSAVPLSLGSDGSPDASAPDEITWNGKTYRLIRVKDWSPMGFCQGWAVRCDPEIT